MFEKLLRWLCPIAGDYWYGVPVPSLEGNSMSPTKSVPCDSMDHVRQAAQEFLDALSAATEHGWEVGDEDRMAQCEALAAYVANKLEHYK